MFDLSRMKICLLQGNTRIYWTNSKALKQENNGLCIDIIFQTNTKKVSETLSEMHFAISKIRYEQPKATDAIKEVQNDYIVLQ